MLSRRASIRQQLTGEAAFVVAYLESGRHDRWRLPHVTARVLRSDQLCKRSASNAHNELESTSNEPKQAEKVSYDLSTAPITSD
jgi:hypothetical protein